MRRGSTPWPLLVGLTALVISPLPARGHPLDEFVQASYVTLADDRLSLEIYLTAGVEIAREVLAFIDRDGDGMIAEEEGRAYAARVLHDIALAVDDDALPLRLTRGDFPSPAAILTGHGTIRLRFVAGSWSSGERGARPGTHLLRFRNDHAPVRSAYLVNAYLPAAPFTIAAQRRDWYQRGAEIDYAVAGSSRQGWISIAASLLVAAAVSAFVLERRRRA